MLGWVSWGARKPLPSGCPGLAAGAQGCFSAKGDGLGWALEQAGQQGAPSGLEGPLLPAIVCPWGSQGSLYGEVHTLAGPPRPPRR